MGIVVCYLCVLCASNALHISYPCARQSFGQRTFGHHSDNTTPQGKRNHTAHTSSSTRRANTQKKNENTILALCVQLDDNLSTPICCTTPRNSRDNFYALFAHVVPPGARGGRGQTAMLAINFYTCSPLQRAQKCVRIGARSGAPVLAPGAAAQPQESCSHTHALKRSVSLRPHRIAIPFRLGDACAYLGLNVARARFRGAKPVCCVWRAALARTVDK